MNKQKSSSRFRFTGAAVLFCALALLVPAVREGNATLYLLAAAVPAGMLLCMTILARLFALDRPVLSLSLFLSALGICAFAAMDPAGAFSQALRCAAGIAALLAGAVLVRSLQPSMLTALCSGFLGILLLTGSLVSPALSLPLSEAALALLLVSFAACLCLSGPFTALLPAVAGTALLLALGETADTLIWSAVFLLLLWGSDGRALPLLCAAGTVLLAFFAAFRLLSVPLFPGNGPALLPEFISAGWTGSDAPSEALLSDSASLFPRLVGGYGLLFSGLSALFFLPLCLRGTAVACAARARFHALLAMGASLLIGLRAMLALLSAFGFLPLSPIALPLLTSSLPPLCAQMFLLGLVCGISGRNEADLAEDAHLAMLAK